MRVVRAILDECVGMVQLLVGRDYLNYEAMKDHHDNDIGFISMFYDYETVETFLRVINTEVIKLSAHKDW